MRRTSLTPCAYIMCALMLVLHLTAGIKEGLYDVEALASYLLYRFNILDPIGMDATTTLSASY